MNVNMHVALAGHLGSGKSTLAGALAARLRAQVASFGSYVRVRALEAGLNGADRSVLQNLGHTLATEEPYKFLADFLARNALSAASDIVYDGVRHMEVWSAIAAHALKVRTISHLIFLETSVETRRLRLIQRGHALIQIEHWQSHAMERELDQIRDAATLILDGAKPLERLVRTFQVAVVSSS